MLSNSVQILVLVVVVIVRAEMEYCDVCPNHTMCIYKGEGPACLGKPISGMDEATKVAVVKAHNAFRRQVAMGKVPGQPPAANMMKLVWDTRLATVAQRWADQCTVKHDECRNDPRFKVGQNIFVGTKDDDTVAIGWKFAVLGWFNEVKQFKAAHISPFKLLRGTGHYTQMVWADSSHIGCGYSAFSDTKMYVCNYGPVGNVKRETMYKKGPACSQCPKGTSCNNGLCA